MEKKRDHSLIHQMFTPDEREGRRKMSIQSYMTGQFLKINWWVGRVCDIARSGQAFELESIYYLAYHTIARQWIPAEKYSRVTEMTQQEAVQYVEEHDLSRLTDILADLDDLEARWKAEPTPSEPFPQPGHFVKVCGWCGRIRDVGEAHDRHFLVIESPKLLSRTSGEYEVLEVKPKGTYRNIQHISQDDAIADIARFRHEVQARIQHAQEILIRWKNGD
jgi:hypothetical protein